MRTYLDRRVIGTIVLLTVIVRVTPPYLSNVKTSPSFLNVQSDSQYLSVNYAVQNQTVTLEGDLIIENDTTYAIENSGFTIKGKIIVKDTSDLIIQNSKLTLNSSWEDLAIVLMNGSSLVITNATIVFNHLGGSDTVIDIRDNAQANITSSRFQNWIYLLVHDSATVHVTNSTVTRLEEIDTVNPSGIATYDTSSATVEGSIGDGVFVWGNSSVSVRNSKFGVVRSGWEKTQNATIQLTNSSVHEIEMGIGTFSLRIESSTVQRAHLNGVNVWVTGSAVGDAEFNAAVSAWFLATSVTEMVARGESRIQLLDSSYGSIQTEDNATVLVGWQLPIVGVVAMPYTWIPIVQTVATLVILIISAVLLVFAYRRWKRRRDEKLRKLAESEASIGSSARCVIDYQYT